MPAVFCKWLRYFFDYVLYSCIFSACIASIIRSYYTWLIAKSPDVTYNYMTMALWGTAEIALGLIISCAPVMPVALRQSITQSFHAYSSWSKSLGQRIWRSPLGSNPWNRSARYRLNRREEEIRGANANDRLQMKAEHFRGHSVDIMPAVLNPHEILSKRLDLESGFEKSLR